MNRVFVFLWYLRTGRKGLPLPKDGRKVESKRRQPQKVPSYHLTGNKSMKFIKEADARAKEKELRDKKN